MELFHETTRIHFMRWKNPAMMFSALLVLGSIALLLVKGLNFGIDFSGGVVVHLKFGGPAPTAEIRHALTRLELGDVVIQEFGAPEEILIRVEKGAEDSVQQGKVADQIVAELKPVAGDKGLEVMRVEYVGPHVGRELTQQGILALLYSLVGILFYVAWRFEVVYSAGAVLALVHDTFICLGYLSLFDREFTLVVVASILTLIGYSINDTIVVFDRIRDERRRFRRKPLNEIVDESVNITLSRTVITSFTVVLVLIALVFFGGEVIFDFAMTLLVGVIVGTYSSIYIASALVLFWENWRGGRQEATVAEAVQGGGE